LICAISPQRRYRFINLNGCSPAIRKGIATLPSHHRTIAPLEHDPEKIMLKRKPRLPRLAAASTDHAA
jgi:hypothetical protein